MYINNNLWLYINCFFVFNYKQNNNDLCLSPIQQLLIILVITYQDETGEVIMLRGHNWPNMQVNLFFSHQNTV